MKQIFNRSNPGSIRVWLSRIHESNGSPPTIHSSRQNRWKKTPDVSQICWSPAGWEWEDDFQTLENTHHFQTDPHTISLPSLEWTSTSRPKNRALPHTCLVLTYIPESDLELWGEKVSDTHTHTRPCGIIYGQSNFPASSQRPPRCHHGLVWHPRLFFSQTASLDLMEKLTNRPELHL